MPKREDHSVVDLMQSIHQQTIKLTIEYAPGRTGQLARRYFSVRRGVKCKLLRVNVTLSLVELVIPFTRNISTQCSTRTQYTPMRGLRIEPQGFLENARVRYMPILVVRIETAIPLRNECVLLITEHAV